MSGHSRETDEAGTAITVRSDDDDSLETGNTLTPIRMIPNPNLLVPNLASEYIGSEYFTVKVYHGGFLQDGLYIGGRHDFYNKFSKDMMSLVEVKNMVNQLEFFIEAQTCEFWYRDGDEDGELIGLQTEADVVQMCSSVPVWRLLILYCDHKVPQKVGGVEHEGDTLLDAHIDYMDHLQSYGPTSLESGDETSDEDEDMTYDPAMIDDEYYQYGKDDDDDDDWEDEEFIVEEEHNEDVHDEGFIEEEDHFNTVYDNQEVLKEKSSMLVEFNPKTDMKNPTFMIDQKFGNAPILRDALKEHAIQNGHEYVLVRNEAKRISAKCKETNCPFELHAIKIPEEDTLIVKMYNPEHKCTRKFNNSMVGKKYLTKKFKDMIALNPDCKPENLAKAMTKEIRSKVNKWTAYRVKVAALEEIEGTIKDQYARIQDYGRELQRVDPKTTIDINCSFSSDSSHPVFKRMYICLGALKEGFKVGCRSVIGLDGTHLKSCFGGQLLIVVGVDADNGSYVVAWAMVEAENKDSWIWFLELLSKDLDIEHEGRGWIFISDKQKGLIPALGQIVSRAEIRFCVRHLWTNFIKQFRDIMLRDKLWACAKSTTLPYFEKEMAVMKESNVEAYNWLTAEERPPRHWCRAFFTTGGNCDIMINNICESFNGWILEARSKAPITIFEDLRVKLMKRIATRKRKMEAYNGGNICPKIREIMEMNKLKAAADCTPTFNGSDIAEVENKTGTKNVVNLGMRTCTCRRWDLSGIPCKHAISAIYLRREDPDEYVSKCYWKSTYLSIYNNLIQPVNSMDLWSRGEDPPIQPPQYSRRPGRPRKSREKASYENQNDGNTTKRKRMQNSLKCSNCKEKGHNKRSCHRHLPPKDNVTAPKSKLKKPKTRINEQTQFVQDTSTPFQQTSRVAATQSQTEGTSFNKVEELRTYKKKSSK